MPLKDAAERPVIVLGAGLAGLAASRELRKVGVPHRIFEKSQQVGGLAVTAEEAGYRFDRTGHLLHLRSDAVKRWAFEALPEPNWLEVKRKSGVYSHGVVSKYPFQSNAFGLPKEVAFACVRDFVTANFATEPRPVVTFEDYCLRWFGEAISQAFMVPYNEKLLGVHPREVDASWCDRFVPRPALDDVLRGAFGLASAELGYNASFFFPRLGMGELGKAIAERAGVVELGREVTAIDVRARAVQVGDERVAYGSLVTTIPLDVLVARMEGAPAAVVAAGRALRKTHLYYLDVALNTPCERPLHWLYVPEPRFPFYRVGCYSHFSAAMAPPGKASLYVELSSREEPRLASLLPAVADGLQELGLIRAPEAIRFARVRKVEHAYVVYDRARAGALEMLRPFLAEHGIVSAGRYAMWEYASMEDAIMQGLAAATRAAAELS
jgi:protoporphyrinogen oxidase